MLFYQFIASVLFIIAEWSLYVNSRRKLTGSEKFGDSIKLVFEDEKLKVESIIFSVLSGLTLILTFLFYRGASGCAY